MLKVLAVASGKGGVGKTLTAVNIALNAARRGLRTALVDADPLSNVMTLLDHRIPERELPQNLDDPAGHTFIAAPGLDVILPQSKSSSSHAGELVRSLLSNHRGWLDERYSLVIVDMPAGTGAGDEFPYLPMVDSLLLVTNPEPTAHVAAGSLLRELEQNWKDQPILVWHNRYKARPDEEFDPDDLLGNYNRNVPKEEQIHWPDLRPVAYIPPDPALDLARTDPPISVNLHRSLYDALEALGEAGLPAIPVTIKDSRSAAMISYYLRKTVPGEKKTEELVDGLEQVLAGFSAKGRNPAGLLQSSGQLPEELRNELKRWLDEAAASPLRRQILKVQQVAALRLDVLENVDTPFSQNFSGHGQSDKALDREMIPLLKSLSYLPGDSPMSRMAALLLYRFALMKLFGNETAVRLIKTFIPHRNEENRLVRDRRRQIARLTGTDAAYQQRYFALVKKLYPVMSRQLDHLVSTFGLQSLLFRNPQGSAARNAYARLFSESIYEMVNSGLGVVAGFRFRPSSRAFTAGYDALLKELGIPG